MSETDGQEDEEEEDGVMGWRQLWWCRGCKVEGAAVLSRRHIFKPVTITSDTGQPHLELELKNRSVTTSHLHLDSQHCSAHELIRISHYKQHHRTVL